MAKRKIKDPHAEREAAKYENPIPSREYILAALQELGRPVKRKELTERLECFSEDDEEGLRRRLRAMERDGQLMMNRRGGYSLVDQMELVRGRVQGHKDGYGFLIPDNGGEDLFISARQMRSVFHGDRILASMSESYRGKKEANIVEILERNTTQVVGRFFERGTLGFVEPQHKNITQDIVIPPAHQDEAATGQVVIVEILNQPTKRSQAIGKIIEVLGDHMAPGLEIDTAIRAHEIPHEWPDEVIEEAKQFAPTVSNNTIHSVTDCRDLPFITIDGDDAKDFDDAVFCEKRAKGWRLMVAIADVSYYVKPESELDKEAVKRGNSVYFPENVIPMLPEVLSNGLCSLNPNVDRLSMICDMNISPSGRVTRFRFFRGVIKSQQRCIYEDVAEFVESPDINPDYPANNKVKESLENLYNLYLVLHGARAHRGAIEFETTETKIIFGENRKIQQIVPVQRNIAHRIIEECMLLANVSAAKFLEKEKMPALYRVHTPPSEERIDNLRDFLKEIGLNLKGGKNPKPKDYAQLLGQIQDRPDQTMIQTVVLRSMTQAVYSPDNRGHFGLAFDAYCHFTSPIRRYPDLLVHRAINHLINHQSAESFHYDENAIEQLGEHSSMTERRADDATREVNSWLKCEFMLDKVGESFEGIITGVTSFGVFVQLNNIFVEGLVHITALKNDYYHFDAGKHRLIGQNTKSTYRLTDPIFVKVVRVDLDELQIDFELV